MRRHRSKSPFLSQSEVGPCRSSSRVPSREEGTIGARASSSIAWTAPSTCMHRWEIAEEIGGRSPRSEAREAR